MRSSLSRPLSPDSSARTWATASGSVSLGANASHNRVSSASAIRNLKATATAGGPGRRCTPAGISLTLVEDCPVDVETGELLAVVTIVTGNGGPFRSFRFAAFIELHPELAHVRTRVKTPGQNGSRERGFGTLKYERLYIDEIDDAVMLAKHAEEYRIEYNEIRPHEAIAWNRPKQVHLGLADPTIPTFQTEKSCQLLDAGQEETRCSPRSRLRRGETTLTPTSGGPTPRQRGTPRP